MRGVKGLGMGWREGIWKGLEGGSKEGMEEGQGKEEIM